MPKSEVWFSPIALEYAHVFNEVTAARNLYEEDRNRIMDYLCNRLIERVGKFKVIRDRTVKPTSSPSDYWRDLYIDCEYTKLRKRLKKKGGDEQAGFEIGFAQPKGDISRGDFCFSAWLFFRHSKDTFKELTVDSSNETLRNLLGVGDCFEAMYDESTYLCVCRILPADPDIFTLENVEEVINKFPRQFEAADQWMTKEYGRLKDLTDRE